MALGVGDESWGMGRGSPWGWSLPTTSLGPSGPGKEGTGKEERCAGIGAVAVVGTSAEHGPACLGPPHPGPTMRN